MHVQLQENVCFICWHILLIWLMHIPCTISKMMMPSENYNSLMAAFPHISTTNSGLVWFPMGTSPWSSSRFQRILGYWCRYWSCSPCLPGFPLSSETSENQQILHNFNIASSSLYTLLQLISSKYMLSIYLHIKYY